MSFTGQPSDDDARQRHAERLFKDSVDHITDRQITTAAELGEKHSQRLESDVPSPLESVWREFKVLLAMLRDYVRGAYREIPIGTVAAVAAAVLYVATPVDAIPDFVPGLGYIDDAAVLVLCLKMIGGDIEKYRRWSAPGVDH